MALRIHELDHWYQEDLEMVMKPPDEIPIVELPILDLPFGETTRVTNIAGLSNDFPCQNSKYREMLGVQLRSFKDI